MRKVCQKNRLSDETRVRRPGIIVGCRLTNACGIGNYDGE